MSLLHAKDTEKTGHEYHVKDRAKRGFVRDQELSLCDGRTSMSLRGNQKSRGQLRGRRLAK